MLYRLWTAGQILTQTAKTRHLNDFQISRMNNNFSYASVKTNLNTHTHTQRQNTRIKQNKMVAHLMVIFAILLRSYFKKKNVLFYFEIDRTESF